MANRLATLELALNTALGARIRALNVACGELTLEVACADYHDTMRILRDDAALQFEQLIDLCGVDYSEYDHGRLDGARFAAVTHLLSLAQNWRVRVRVYAPVGEMPILPSLTDLWPAADWYEREAFDLFGILFEGHPDLRRILTDYGFTGHPFRKDFPVSGYVEMRYDTEQQRVVYQPVTIEPREITPRVQREPGYGARHG